MQPWKILKVALLLLTLIFVGCGSSDEDMVTDSSDNPNNMQPQGPVAHQSWGSYRLYRYENGDWFPLIDLGNEVEQVPNLGDTPVLILHGLGSRIDTGRFNALAENLIANGATRVIGFEYDSLDPISTSSTYLNLAIAYLTSEETNLQWRVVGHSLGALVARSSFESGATFDMASDGNRVSFPAGPHLGSPIAEELQESDPDLVEQALQEAVLDNELDFRNADGTPVDVTGDEPVFAQLVPGSLFLENLNFEAANQHPQFNYYTVAGTERGDALEALNRILGVFADDGLVDVESANAGVIGPIQTDTVPYDHTEIVEAQSAILVIQDHLGLLP